MDQENQQTWRGQWEIANCKGEYFLFCCWYELDNDLMRFFTPTMHMPHLRQVCGYLCISSGLFSLHEMHLSLRMVSIALLCIYNLLSLIQQEIENFKKLNLINKDEFVSLAPETADPTQEVPPRPPGLQKGKMEVFVFQNLCNKEQLCRSFDSFCLCSILVLVQSTVWGSFFFANFSNYQLFMSSVASVEWQEAGACSALLSLSTSTRCSLFDLEFTMCKVKAKLWNVL